MECLHGAKVLHFASQIELLCRREFQNLNVAADVSQMIPCALTSFCLAIDFKIRKLPQMRVHNSSWTLPDEKFSVAFDDEGEKCRAVAVSRLPRFGNSSDAIFLESDAKFFDRTNQALRISRRANQRAEFHQ